MLTEGVFSGRGARRSGNARARFRRATAKCSISSPVAGGIEAQLPDVEVAGEKVLVPPDAVAAIGEIDLGLGDWKKRPKQIQAR